LRSHPSQAHPYPCCRSVEKGISLFLFLFLILIRVRRAKGLVGAARDIQVELEVQSRPLRSGGAVPGRRCGSSEVVRSLFDSLAKAVDQNRPLSVLEILQGIELPGLRPGDEDLFIGLSTVVLGGKQAVSPGNRYPGESLGRFNELDRKSVV